MKVLLDKFLSFIAGVAFNSTSVLLVYEPDMPDGLEEELLCCVTSDFAENRKR